MKLDLEKLRQAVTLYRAGFTAHRDIADMVGVEPATVGGWFDRGFDLRADGVEGEPVWEQGSDGEAMWSLDSYRGDPYVTLVNACGRARATRSVGLVRKIEKHADESYQAAAYLLERTERDAFGKRSIDHEVQVRLTSFEAARSLDDVGADDALRALGIDPKTGKVVAEDQ